MRPSHRRVALAAICLATTFGLVASQSAAPHRMDLREYVSQYVSSVPGRDTEGYSVPTADEGRSFAAALAAVRSGNDERARDLLRPLDYELIEAVDSATGASLVLLREQPPPDGQSGRGWGLYVFRRHAINPLVVQVPHPVYDVNTPDLGVSAFRQGDAQALFVAGAHRYANGDSTSDVAHNADSMFQLATRSVVTADTLVLQLHGFDQASHPDHGEVVVSGGDTPPSPVSTDVATALRAESFDVCLFDADDCGDLGATTNVQGAWCRAVGAHFLHLEASRHVREDAVRSEALVASTVEALLATGS